MPKRLAPLFAFAGIAMSWGIPVALAGQQDERIAASFLLAVGRAPSADEVEHWSKREPRSIADLVADLRRELQSDPAKARAAIVQSCQDAFGREPSEDEIKALAGHGSTYVDLMKRHIESLATQPEEYEQVMHRAYQVVIRRDAYAPEVEYWTDRSTLPFALLAACIDDWARRNQPGLMVTTGIPTVSINSRFLTTARLSPATAAEARLAAGLPAAEDAARAAATGRNVVAAGAGDIVSNGQIHFVATGNARLIPSRGQPLVRSP